MASSPCRATEGGWTLGSLVGTCLDLALAYLCLCAAAVAFFAAKFLGLFGIPLPCSCAGQAAQGHLHRRHRPDSVCLQTLLRDYPTAKIAGVHMSLRSRFPLHALCYDCRRRLSASCCCCSSGSRLYDIKLVNDDDSSDDEGGHGGGRRTLPLLAMGDGEESCGSVSKPLRASGSLLSLSAIASGEVAPELETSFRLGGSPVDVKRKGVLSTRPSSALRRRRRGRNSLIIRGKSPPVQPSTPLQLGWQGEGATRNSVDIGSQSQQVVWEGRSEPTAVTQAGLQNSGDRDELVGRAVSAVEYNFEDKDSLCGEKIMLGSERNESSIIRDLKQALEEEKSARAALLLELEKERNSAATAADEAMAMIFRLQEEKAAIEMEDRQYKRMAEEKSAYDEEEMDILKEIIMRRERETHVLEKEIESYREMMLNNNGVSENDAKNEVHQIAEDKNLFQSSDDTELMLKEIYKSIKKEKAENKRHYLDDCGTSATKENNLASSSLIHLLSLDESVDISYLNQDSVRLRPLKHQNVPYHGDECKVEEKGMVTVEDCASSLQIQRSAKDFHSCMWDAPVDDNIHEPTSHLPNEEKGADDREVKMRDPLDYSSTKHDPTSTIINSKAFQCDNEVSILDVHVIDDIADHGGQGKEKDLSQVGHASNTSKEYNARKQPIFPIMVGHSTLEELNMHRSCSDSIMGLSATCSRSYPRTSLSDLRRRSMSSVDSERFRLENEVEVLRKRLKIIQEGREKFSVSLEQREKEIYHLRVLEEISCQLHEIRKATETGKNIRRASLPPSSSKVTLKKRRCRSVSTEQQEST